MQELKLLTWKMYRILKKAGYADALAREYMRISTELIIGGIFDVKGGEHLGGNH